MPDDPRNAAYAELTRQGYLATSKTDRMAVVDLIVSAVEPLIRADERDKFMEEARSDLAAAVLINEALANERERIAQAIEDRCDHARISDSGLWLSPCDRCMKYARIARNLDGG